MQNKCCCCCCTLMAAPPATDSQSASHPEAKDLGALDQSGKHNHSLDFCVKTCKLVEFNFLMGSWCKTKLKKREMIIESGVVNGTNGIVALLKSKQGRSRARTRTLDPALCSNREVVFGYNKVKK